MTGTADSGDRAAAASAAPMGVPLRGSEGALATAFDVAVLDLDGTVYVGPNVLPGVPDAVARTEALGVRSLYLTNNASRTAEATAEHLRELGLSATAADVVTSAQAVADLLAGELAAGSPVLVVGGEGLRAALAAEGLVAVDSADDKPAAVAQGFAPEVGWRLLTEGALAVGAGAPWVASNRDRTLPIARGIAPGNGTLVQVIAMATGVEPRVVGKPERAVLDLALRRSGAQRPLLVGDRLDTDIACAVRAQLPSLLVLTGVTDAALLLAAVPEQRPTYVSARLDGLLDEHPPVRDDGSGRCACRAAVASVVDGRLVLEADDDSVDGEDALRAACAAAWAWADEHGEVPDVSSALGRWSFPH